jgi:hypothetical protein
MKKKLFFPAIILLFFAACTPQNYYQLVETIPVSESIAGEYLLYENEDLQINYNLWGDRGNGSFIVHNKSTKDVFIDLKRSHLIINGFAYTYFQNRNFSSPKISFFSSATDETIIEQSSIKLPGVSDKKVKVQSEESVTFLEERIICIPPGCSKLVYGFDLQNEVFRDCSLWRFPTAKQIVSSEFTKESSPLVFKNRITYSFDETMATAKNIENEFWAKKITNYPENLFVNYEAIKFCNDSSSYTAVTYPMQKPTSFYFLYKLEPGRINH